jgi:hypothetical protein
MGVLVESQYAAVIWLDEHTKGFSAFLGHGVSSLMKVEGAQVPSSWGVLTERRILYVKGRWGVGNLLYGDHFKPGATQRAELDPLLVSCTMSANLPDGFDARIRESCIRHR